MPSDRQIEANRRNARKSTGPRTEDGKRKSRLNAFRHGLTGQLDIMTGETREAHDAFIAGIVGSLHPAGALENQLAHSIAESYWRMNRIPVFENALLAQGDYVQFEHNRRRGYSDLDRALSAARAFIEDPARFNLLTVYEARLHRKTQADLKQLREIQAARRAAANSEKVTVSPAPKPLAEPPQPTAPADPAPENGFVFSAAQSASPDAARRLPVASSEQIPRDAPAHPIPEIVSPPAAHA